MIEKTCKTCTQAVEAKHKNATYCSDLCHPNASRKLRDKAVDCVSLGDLTSTPNTAYGTIG